MDSKNPYFAKHVCGTCEHWCPQYPRQMRNDKMTASASGSCIVLNCLCLKYEDQKCCHGHHNWKGPMAHTITVSQTIVEDVTYVMPWQPGYQEWADKNPGLVDGTISLVPIVKTWKEKTNE